MKPQLCTLTLSPCFCPSHPVYNDHIHILLTFYSFSRLISSFIHLSLSLSLSHMWYAVLCINDVCEIMFICVSSDTCVPWCKHGAGDQCHMLALAFYFFFLTWGLFIVFPTVCSRLAGQEFPGSLPYLFLIFLQEHKDHRCV